MSASSTTRVSLRSSLTSSGFFSPEHMKPSMAGVSESTVDPAFIGCAKILLTDIVGQSREGVLFEGCPMYKREGRTAGVISIQVTCGQTAEDVARSAAATHAALSPPSGPHSVNNHNHGNNAASPGGVSVGGNGRDDWEAVASPSGRRSIVGAVSTPVIRRGSSVEPSRRPSVAVVVVGSGPAGADVDIDDLVDDASNTSPQAASITGSSAREPAVPRRNSSGRGNLSARSESREEMLERVKREEAAFRRHMPPLMSSASSGSTTGGTGSNASGGGLTALRTFDDDVDSKIFV